MTTPEYDPGKFAELVLYIAAKSAGDPRFGWTKLYKILYYCDFRAYRLLGFAITGSPYRKLERGPAPTNVRQVIRQLEDQGDARDGIADYYGRTQHRVIPLRKPDLSDFTGEEIALVHEVLEELLSFDGTGVSDLSHGHAGWQMAELYGDIPYETASISTRPLTWAEDLQMARAIGEREHGHRD